MNRTIPQEDFLDNVHEVVRASLPPIHPFKVDEAEYYHLLGGKSSAYNRPLLAFHSAQTFGRVTRRNNQKVGYVSLKDIALCGAAVQFAHESSVVVDDWMDEETSRRGQTPLYAHPEFGPEIAVMTGLRFLSRAHQMIAQTYLPREMKKDLGLLLHSAAQDMSRGQELDRCVSDTLAPETVLEMYRLKTGVLFGWALETGALVVDASSDQRALARALGQNVGVVYQLRDDLKDLEEDTSRAQQRGSRGIANSLPALLSPNEVVAINNRYLETIRQQIGGLPEGKESPLGELIGIFVSERGQ